MKPSTPSILNHPTTIGFVSTMHATPWGGSEDLWHQTALCLRQAGTPVVVNVMGWDSEPVKIRGLREAGAAIKARQRMTRLNRLRARLGGQSEADWLDRAGVGLGVISMGNPYEGIDWMDACRRRGIPFVPIVQAAAEAIWPDDETLDRAAMNYPLAKRVFFVSEANRRLVERQLGVPLPEARVARNPYKVAYDADPAWPSSQTGFRLACVGRLDANSKGQDLVLEVLHQPRWRERDLRVTFYGRGINDRSLRRHHAWLDVPNVAFGNHVENVEEIWKTHHALIMPSRFEGLPLAVVEAMLCGRMSIVTDVGGTTELVRESIEGFVAEAPTVMALDAAMERAWVRRDDWAAMGQAAARRARELVPSNPGQVLADQLLALVHRGQSSETEAAGCQG